MVVMGIASLDGGEGALRLMGEDGVALLDGQGLFF